MMYQEYNGDYYKWNGEELVGSIIYHDEHDGVHPNTHGVQIHPIDGGLVVVGYLKHDDLDVIFAKATLDAALEAAHTYEWWVQNGAAWFDAWCNFVV